MPKSKVRKKPATATASRAAQTSASSAVRVKAAGPSSPLFIGVMIGLMLLGLLWLVVNYLWGDSIPLMRELGNWNFLIGFALMVVGLMMTMKWR